MSESEPESATRPEPGSAAEVHDEANASFASKPEEPAEQTGGSEAGRGAASGSSAGSLSADNSLLRTLQSVLPGKRDSDVDDAVRAQLEKVLTDDVVSTLSPHDEAAIGVDLASQQSVVARSDVDVERGTKVDFKLGSVEPDGKAASTSSATVSAALYSDTYDERRVAAAVCRRMLRRRSYLTRRLERISWHDERTLMRQVEVTVDPTSAAEVAEANSIALDLTFLGFLPKGLLQAVTVRDAAGVRVPVVARETGTRFGQAFLVEFARANIDGLGDAPSSVWRRLFVLAHMYPEFPLRRQSTASIGAWARTMRDADFTKRDVQPLDESGERWWDAAAQSSSWCWWLRRFVVNMPVLVAAPGRLFELQWRDLNPPARMGSLQSTQFQTSRAGFDYKIALHDFGRAASEHVEVEAPAGVFLTGGVILKWDRAVPTRSRLSPPRQHHYLSSREPREPGRCRLYLRAIADPRGFLVPLRALSAYSAILILVLATLQTSINIIQRLDSSTETISALMLFIPALVIPVLFAGQEHALRWRLLYGWRRLTLWLFGPLPVAIVMLTLPSGDRMRWVWASILCAMALLVNVLAIILDRGVRDVQAQYRKALANEGLSPFGDRQRAPGTASATGATKASR